MLPVPALLSIVSISVTPPSDETFPVPGRQEELEEPEGEQLPSGRTDDYLQEVLSSCQTALGPDQCLPPGEDDADWEARVVFFEDAVQVTLTRPSHTVVRRLDFLPADSEQQRRVAAGLLVAAMAAAAKLSDEPEPKPPEPSPPPPPPSEEEPVEAPEPAGRDRFATLGAALTVGPTLGAPHWGLGGYLGATFWAGPGWGVSVGARGATSSQDDVLVAVVQPELGLRFALLRDPKTFDWWASAQGVVDVVRVRDSVSESDPQTAVRGGVRLQTTWGLHRPVVTPFVGFAVTALSPALEVRRDDSRLLLAPPVLGGAFLGLRYNH